MSVSKSIIVALVTGLILACGIGTSIAQEASESHLEAARRTIKASGSTNRLDGILPQMAENAKNEMIRTQPDKDTIITEIVDTAAIELAPRRGDLENEVAQIFARVFTEDELKVIADFFLTEAGKKFLTESPIVVREIDRASRVWGNGINRDLNKKVGEKLKEAGLR